MDEWEATVDGESRRVAVPGAPPAFAGAETVRYTTTAPDPGGEAATLVLDGVYARAKVEADADRLGGAWPATADAYFDPVRVPVRPDGETALTVTCHAPDDRFGGLHDTDRVPDADSVPGIWWDARVEPHPLPAVLDLRVRPQVTGENARLHVRATLVTDGPLTDAVTYSLRPAGDRSGRGLMDRGRVDVGDAGLATVEHTVDVRDPSLWWPRDLGEQHRYSLTAKLGDSERTVTTGVREVTRTDGRVLVNGERLPVRGVNLVTADPDDVARAVETNATLVRGHAQVLPPAVYEACDEAGLVVWQDLPLTGPGAFDADRGADLARRLTARYGAHPSLGVVSVHDEPVAFADTLGGGLLDRLRLRWRAWRAGYDRTAAEDVAAAVEGVPAVPVVGGPGVDHDAAAYYPGWKYGCPDDVDALLDRYPADLLAEFGAAAPAEGGDLAPGPDAATHAARVDGDWAVSQASQADLLATVAGRARCRGVGAVAFALRDAAPGGGMGVYAADGAPKRGQDALAAAFAPVRAFWDGRAAVVVNDRPEPLAGTLSWTAGGDSEASGERPVEVGALDRWRGELSVPPGATGVAVDLTVDRAARETHTP